MIQLKLNTSWRAKVLQPHRQREMRPGSKQLCVGEAFFRCSIYQKLPKVITRVVIEVTNFWLTVRSTAFEVEVEVDSRWVFIFLYLGLCSEVYVPFWRASKSYISVRYDGINFELFAKSKNDKKRGGLFPPPYPNTLTRTRTNTNPNDTQANAAGRRGVRVRSANGTFENQGAWGAKCLAMREALVGGVYSGNAHR